MVRALKKRNERGFTLVELLIVVAIIGVLSTVGIPTFRRMIQKSKKSEAQVNLGNLFTIEQAFLSEYGLYGNNLRSMGFQIDGGANNLTYTVGFMTTAGACNVGVTAILPLVGTPQGAAINAAIASYYPGILIPGATNSGIAGRTSVTGAACPLAVSSDVGVAPTFTAMAGGYIQPGANKDTGVGALATGAGGSAFDQWTITQARVLTNTFDGVN